MALTKQQLQTLQRAGLDGPNKVRKAMELAGVTQVQLADAVGLTQPHVSDIANGKVSQRGLPLETARSLSDYFGCSIEDLFPPREAVAS